MGDLVYRHILGPSPEFDWRKAREIAGPDKWRRMCELALIEGRYGGQYGLPLANEGEFALLRRLVSFGDPQQASLRFEAEKNLIEVASHLPDHRGHAEIRRCLDLDDRRWRAGPWIIEALDRLCCEVLEKAERATHADGPATEAASLDPASTQMSLSIPTPPLPEHSYPDIDDVLRAMAEAGVRPPRTQNWSRTARQVAAARGVPRTEPGHHPKTVQRHWVKLELPTQ